MSAVGYVVKSMLVEIEHGAATVAYECAVRGVTETPAADTVTTQTACPDGVKTDTGPVTWTLTIEYNVSNLPASLHRLLRDNAGAPATVTIEPFPADEPGTLITYPVRLTPAGAAYTVGQFGSASVVLPLTGPPVTVDPA